MLEVAAEIVSHPEKGVKGIGHHDGSGRVLRDEALAA